MILNVEKVQRQYKPKLISQRNRSIFSKCRSYRNILSMNIWWKWLFIKFQFIEFTFCIFTNIYKRIIIHWMHKKLLNSNCETTKKEIVMYHNTGIQKLHVFIGSFVKWSWWNTIISVVYPCIKHTYMNLYLYLCAMW